MLGGAEGRLGFDEPIEKNDKWAWGHWGAST